jgi:molecular chaperone DnaK
VEARNQLDGMVYTAEKTLKDAAEKAGDEDKKALEEQIAEAKKVLEGEDAEAMTKAGETLSEAMQKVGAAMYADMPGAEGAPEEVEATEADGKTDEPVEGEVVDETKEEK